MNVSLKSNILYESIEELDLPDDRDQNILKDELIKFTIKDAKNAGLENAIFRLVTVYKEDENKVIHLITNQIDWQAVTRIRIKSWGVPYSLSR